MAFELNNLGRVGSGVSSSMASWNYLSLDNIADIGTPGYFNEAKNLNVADCVLIFGSDGAGFYRVTDVDPEVSIEAIGESSGSGIGDIGLGRWTFNDSGAAAGAGQISFDNVDPSQATLLYIATTNADGVDAIDFIDNTIGPGSIIYVQSNANPDKGFSIRAASAAITPGLATIPIDHIISTPSGLSNGEKLGLTISQGYANPTDIVNAINQALGQNFWQQGISNAIFVNDFSAGSTDLAPYLATSGPNAGKWEVGSASTVGTTLMVVNTDRSSLSAIAEREIVKVGELQIVSSTPGQTKGIVMTAGVGEPSMDHLISSQTSGSLSIECILFSDDVSRPAFDIQQADGFFFSGIGWALANPGLINTRTIDIDCDFIFVQQVPCVIGADCQFFNPGNYNMEAPFLDSVVGFDLTSTPSIAPRRIRNSGVVTTSGSAAGQAAFIIDEDNGENIGFFAGEKSLTPPGNRFITAINDPAFNANPEKSVNFDFDVDNFVVTQRLAEVGIVAGSTTTINNPDEATDLEGPFILDFSSTSGFEIDPSNGAIINKLRTPATYKFTFELSGNKVGGGTSDFEIYANYKPAGGVYAPISVDDGVNSAPVKNRNEFTAGADPGVLGFSFTQRFENIDDEVKIQIADIVDDDDWVSESMQFIAVRVG